MSLPPLASRPGGPRSAVPRGPSWLHSGQGAYPSGPGTSSLSASAPRWGRSPVGRPPCAPVGQWDRRVPGVCPTAAAPRGDHVLWLLPRGRAAPRRDHELWPLPRGRASPRVPVELMPCRAVRPPPPSRRAARAARAASARRSRPPRWAARLWASLTSLTSFSSLSAHVLRTFLSVTDPPLLPGEKDAIQHPRGRLRRSEQQAGTQATGGLRHSQIDVRAKAADAPTPPGLLGLHRQRLAPDQKSPGAPYLTTSVNKGTARYGRSPYATASREE